MFVATSHNMKCWGHRLKLWSEYQYQGNLCKIDIKFCPHIYYAPAIRHLGALSISQVYAKFENKILLKLTLNPK